MTRKQRAIEYAKQIMIDQNPWMADRQTRIDWWSKSHPFEKEWFIESITMIAESDLRREEKLVPDEEVK